MRQRSMVWALAAHGWVDAASSGDKRLGDAAFLPITICRPVLVPVKQSDADAAIFERWVRCHETLSQTRLSRGLLTPGP
jgi:hypothetical protein